MKYVSENKSDFVKNVFNKVFNKYDLMNDLLSLGSHRIWKKQMIQWLYPKKKTVLIDMACGTGDITELFLKYVNNECKVYASDPNEKMLNLAKKKLKKHKNIKWCLNKAEKLEFENNFFDYYTISFGIRNVTNINQVLKEAHRVLKPGGRFLCLEFSKVQNLNLEKIYKKYSKIIPYIGKAIVGSEEPYKYLTKSIEEFVNQDELIDLMKKNKFEYCSYRNLSGGIVAIHSGWKI